MPAKFDFLSPGVLLREIDQSQIPAEVVADGPVIIGRARSGPGNKPVKVRNLEDFYAVFGEPVSGMGSVNNDVWREGNLQGATYGMYAAQAWLAAEVSPITYVRLLGEHDPNAASNGKAGWDVQALATAGGGTFGLFMIPSGTAGATNFTGSLAAVFYTTNASTSVVLSGTLAGGGDNAQNCAALMDSVDIDGSPGFTVLVGDPSSLSTAEKISFNFNPDSKKYIRKSFNTNPQKSNSSIMETTTNYFLGESYEEAVETYVTKVSASAGSSYGIILPLSASAAEWGDNRREAKAPTTGWFFSKDTGLKADYKAENMEKLFRIHSLHEGSWIQNKYSIGIKVVSLGTTFDPYSRFDLQVLEASSNKIVEEYRNLNLNPGDLDYIAKRIGDMSQEWDDDQKKYRVLGEYANISDIVRVEVAEAVKFQQLSDASAVPFGFYGPPRFKGFSAISGATNVTAFSETLNNPNADGKATAIWDYTGIPADLNDEVQFVLVDSDGTNHTFTYKNDINTVTDNNIGYQNYSGAADTAENREGIAARTAAAINDASATTSGKITATIGYDGDNEKVVFTQAKTGSAGNKANSEDIGNIGFTLADFTGGGLALPSTIVIGSGSKTPALHADIDGSDKPMFHVPSNWTGSFKFPSLRLSISASNGSHDDNYSKKDYLGVNHQLYESSIQDKSYSELLRSLPQQSDGSGYEGQLAETTALGDSLEYSFIFSLDDVQYDESTKKGFYLSGSRKDGNSYTAKSGSADLITGSLLNKFVAPMYGGCDGVDITEMEPFSNRALKLQSSVDSKNYTAYTMNKVLDSISDSEVVSYDLMTVPGMTVPKFTDRVVEICEDRGDALAIIDTEDNFVPRPESTSTSTGSVDACVRNFKSRNMNSSYGCTYYPWVRLKDTANGANDVLMCPPSVAALGAMGRSQAVSEPWFAPAGFNRGGLSPLGGAKGPDVVGTWEHLTKDNRDSLYEANINPIARFPSTGDIVIFGQKTLQQTPSALDRINVRRLMIFLKKQIGVIADTILFDQNVEVTWNRFKTQANAVLGDVQAKLGITEYKLVLDKTTTTPDLIDRNILYAKIFVKPARAIEFIVVDFIITRSGVEF